MLSVEQVELETRRRRSARLTVGGSSACFCAELSFFEVTVSARRGSALDLMSTGEARRTGRVSALHGRAGRCPRALR